eukprot:tig00001164_g7408.t1
MSFSVFSQPQPPTGIEHCVRAAFTGPDDVNLIVARSSVIEVFRVIVRGVDGERLELLGQYPLFGNVESMRVVRFSGLSTDSLLLVFREAKLSIVDWDASTHDLRTEQIYSWEDKPELDLKDGRHDAGAMVPMLRIDPQHRCGALLLHGSRLVLLAFEAGAAGPSGSGQLIGDDDEPFADASDAPHSARTPKGAETAEVRAGRRIRSQHMVPLGELGEAPGVGRVVDLCFLDGYLEPTLLFLHASAHLWAGRAAAVPRRDIVAATAVSINLHAQLYPQIWSVTGLPYDCEQAVGVPAPAGGALVLTPHAAVYVNAAVQRALLVNGYGVAQAADEATFSPAVSSTDTGLTLLLDGASVAFLSGAPPRALVVLRSGELFTLALAADARGVRAMHLRRVGMAVPATVLTTIPERNLVLLGSRLADALLLSYSEGPAAEREAGESERKRRRVEGPEGQEEDEGEMEQLFGGGEGAGGPARGATTLKFAVREVLHVAAPVADLAAGEAYEPPQAEPEPAAGRSMDLVACVGRGRSGALCVLQQSVRPEVITSFEVPGSRAVWLLHHSPGGPSKQPAGAEWDADWHSYMVISLEDATLVLSTGDELEEISDRVDFWTAGRTVECGSLLQRRRIVQVTPASLLLLDGTRLAQEVTIDGAEVAAASVADPYVMLLLKDGSARLFAAEAADGRLREVAVAMAHQGPASRADAITALTLYADASSPAFELPGQGSVDVGELERRGAAPPAAAAAASDAAADAADEEAALYGDSRPDAPPEGAAAGSAPPAAERAKEAAVQQRIFCAVCRASGLFEIYTLPDFALVFAAPRLPVGFPLYRHVASAENEVKEAKAVRVVDLALHQFADGTCPVLAALLNTGELLLYRSFHFTEGPGPATRHPGPSRLPLRFRRVNFGVVTRSAKAVAPVPPAGAAGGGPQGESPGRLVRFENVGERSGLFVSGERPLWVFANRGHPVVHPMQGPVLGFGAFHNVNCPRGFVSLAAGAVRIGRLRAGVAYEQPWPARKIAMRCTPHLVTYHPETQVYAVAVSSPAPPLAKEQIPTVTKIDAATGEEVSAPLWPEARPRCPQAVDDAYEVRLLDPALDFAVQDRFAMERNEAVVCLRAVTLKNLVTSPSGPNLPPRLTDAGPRQVLAVGTGITVGEDQPGKGRVLVFEVRRGPAADGAGRGAAGLRLAYQREQRGAVTAVAAMEGYLVVGVGQKVYVYMWQNEQELVGAAFFDAGLATVALHAVKNFLLVADIFQSSALMRWKEGEQRQLLPLGKDWERAQTYAAEFVIDHTSLGLLMSDHNKNLIVFNYAPSNVESRGGQRLLRHGLFHVGSRINKFVRLKMGSPGAGKSAAAQKATRHALFFGTLDGGLGFVAPIPEASFRRLHALSARLVTAVPHYAGLNPSAFRAFRGEVARSDCAAQNVVDGELVAAYAFLDGKEQKALAASIASSPATLIADLAELQAACTLF